MNIDTFNGQQFQGTVKEDMGTGGMSAVGEIEGTLKAGRLHFVKRMPLHEMMFNDGSRKTSQMQHAEIFYDGRLSLDGASAEGTWKIRERFRMVGWKPMVFRTHSGKWMMKTE
ncbi:MAG: hypothetical protein IPN44_15405 [Flavobacteriales bacterium]|nr:hypothetical protein [Flavobacteriales bacterium]